MNCFLSKSFQIGLRMDFPQPSPRALLLDYFFPASSSRVYSPPPHPKLLGKSSNTKRTEFFASLLLEGFCIIAEKLMEAQNRINLHCSYFKVSFQLCRLKNFQKQFRFLRCRWHWSPSRHLPIKISYLSRLVHSFEETLPICQSLVQLHLRHL